LAGIAGVDPFLTLLSDFFIKNRRKRDADSLEILGKMLLRSDSEEKNIRKKDA
jgi:hypothetical protein